MMHKLVYWYLENCFEIELFTLTTIVLLIGWSLFIISIKLYPLVEDVHFINTNPHRDTVNEKKFLEKQQKHPNLSLNLMFGRRYKIWLMHYQLNLTIKNKKKTISNRIHVKCYFMHANYQYEFPAQHLLIVWKWCHFVSKNIKYKIGSFSVNIPFIHLKFP